MFNIIPWKKKETGRGLTPVKAHPLAELRNEFDALCDRFLGRWSLPRFEDFGRRGLDLEDRDDEVVVRAEVPGFEANDLDVQVSGQLLTVKAEKKQDKKGKNGFDERSHRMFQQTVQLPLGTRLDQAEAKYHNGVLELHVPKEEASRPKKIEVKA